jgi:signal transduction histidine kinase
VSIKRKLTVIALLLALLLICTSGFLVWSSLKSLRRVENANVSVQSLYAASEVRAHINRQIIEVLETMLLAEKSDIDDFNLFAGKSRDAFGQWVAIEEKSMANGEEDGESHVQRIVAMSKLYDEALKPMTKALQLGAAGRRQQAFVVMEDQAESIIYDQLFRQIDEATALERDEVDEAYSGVLFGLGSVPWMPEKAINEVRRADAAVNYYLAVDRVNTSINRQMAKVTDYLIAGEKISSSEGYAFESATDNAFATWDVVARQQEKLGQQGWNEHLQTLAKVRKSYDKILVSYRSVIRLMNEGRVEEARQLLAMKVSRPVDAELFGPLAREMEGCKGEISETQQRLHSSTLHTGWGGVVVMLVALLILVISGKMTGGIIHSVGKLKAGVAQLRAGEYCSRIELAGRDELAELAHSFNDMCSELERSRNELLAAKEKSEQTAQELHEINEEMQNFTYIVSHDLRAPLVSITGFSAELKGAVKEISPLVASSIGQLPAAEQQRVTAMLKEDLHDSLDFIGSSVKRMDRLIDNILHLSRHGRRELKAETVPMEPLVQEILNSLGHQIEEKRVTVTLGTLPTLVGDKVALEQIMGNLIDNALKYLQPGRDGELSITAHDTNGMVTFQIRDNGRGIAPEDQHKVFDLFRRVGTQDVQGDGMGLTYVKTLVRRHGGRIWCSSEPGVGSTFSFSMLANAGTSFSLRGETV